MTGVLVLYYKYVLYFSICIFEVHAGIEFVIEKKMFLKEEDFDSRFLLGLEAKFYDE